MKLLSISDLHGNHASLERILAKAGPVDAVLLGGDITNFGSPMDAQRLIRLAQDAGNRVLAVAGNCDSAEIDRCLTEWGVSAAGRGITLGSVGVHGLSGVPPWKRGMYQLTEEELAASLQAGYEQLASPQHHVILSHVPPRGLHVDRTFLLRHAGSTALRSFAEQTRPALIFCGHIHEGRGMDQLGPTLVANCGEGAAGYFGLAEIDQQVTVHIRKA
jgi:Icc-related predicted phosphoesterase